MSATNLVRLFVLCLTFSGSNLAHAQEPADPLPSADLAEWITQLDADRFTDRQAASEKLAQAGSRAIPALIAAAESGSLEVSARAVNILSHHLTQGDAATQADAKAALEKLAQSNNAVVARRAKTALEESQKPPVAAPANQVLPLRILGNGGIQIQGGQIQIQVQGNNAAPVRRIVMTNNNGVKQIDAEEGGRRVKIKDDPANGIEMEVAETKDGKTTSQKYQAKNADDLKKNHPEAYKVYQQYANQAHVNAQPAGNAARRSAEIRIDSLQRLVESLERSADLMEKDLGKDKAKQLKQHLANVRQELDQAKKSLADDAEKAAAEKDEAEANPKDG